MEKIFLNRIQKALNVKGKISKLLYTKIKNISSKGGEPLFTGRDWEAERQNGKDV